jgi:hypothetical protein
MTIAAIIALITQIGPLGVQLFLALEARMNLGPDEKLNIANALAAADAADQATINSVAAWMLANGFKANVTFTAK